MVSRRAALTTGLALAGLPLLAGCRQRGSAAQSPDRVYRTMNLNGLWVRENGLFMAPANKGRYYHDGRFKTLLDVVNHYDRCKSLALTEREKLDLVEYLKSLPEKEEKARKSK